MSDEDHNKLAARVIAHERVLAFLLSRLMKGLSDAQRTLLEKVMNEPFSASSIGIDLDLDIGTADDLAGLALDYRDAMNHLFRLALAAADNPAV